MTKRASNAILRHLNPTQIFLERRYDEIEQTNAAPSQQVADRLKLAAKAGNFGDFRIAGLGLESGSTLVFRSSLSVERMAQGKAPSFKPLLQFTSLEMSSGKPRFPSEFFPDTAWEKSTKAAIRFTVRRGASSMTGSVRKHTDRWRGHSERPSRNVEYIDLARIQPMSSRTGYQRIAKSSAKETSASAIEENTVNRLSEIMGRQYQGGKMAKTDVDETRSVPVLSVEGNRASGFHLGAGEFTITELLQKKAARYSLLIIDEIETSLHPRAQRRLVRDLAENCRQNEWQVILSTHSPFVLGELPPEGRGYIMRNQGKKQVVFGVSPEFAMTQMDEDLHPECDVYVEDERAKLLLIEILVRFASHLVDRMEIIPFGTASVGNALGQMVQQGRFPRPSAVFLDGDQSDAPGCTLLPGGDAPEIVVFEALKKKQWSLLDAMTGREFVSLSKACEVAMSASNHHEWVTSAANRIKLSDETLWQAMCSTWVANCLEEHEARSVIEAIENILIDKH